MDLERGFWRLTLVASAGFLAGGLAFTLWLTLAIIREDAADRATDEALIAAGCLPQREKATIPAEARRFTLTHRNYGVLEASTAWVASSASGRWRVMVDKDKGPSKQPEPFSGQTYAVEAHEPLTPKEVVQAWMAAENWMRKNYSVPMWFAAVGRDPEGGFIVAAFRNDEHKISVTDCGGYQVESLWPTYKKDPNVKRVEWWSDRVMWPFNAGVLPWSWLPPSLMERMVEGRWRLAYKMLFLLTPALGLTVLCAAIPWGAFLLSRWIVRGFMN